MYVFSSSSATKKICDNDGLRREQDCVKSKVSVVDTEVGSGALYMYVCCVCCGFGVLLCTLAWNLDWWLRGRS